MSIKELKDGMKEDKVVFGIKQALKLSKGKKKPRVFVVRDTREDTIKRLELGKIKIESLGRVDKEAVAKELDLDFESEVFTLI